jgi:MFS family permease
MNSFTRNVPLLALCQALMMSANAMIVTSAALVGYALAEDKSLATVPLAVQFIAVMLTSIPASLLMGYIGRKRGFMLATVLGIGGGMITTTAIVIGSFWLFVLGTALVGMFNGFGNYYRFAAADSVSITQKSRAISYVMAGGVISAIVGPNLARFTKEFIESASFAGSYASLIAIYILSLATVSLLKLPYTTSSNTQAIQATARPIAHIAAQPRFITALICGMFGYGVMSLVMTATPLAMHHHNHDFGDTSFVISWHVLAMFAPSFFTGHLIRCFGVVIILFVGALMGIACLAINLIGTDVTHFWLALVMLGLSWNFLFIGATTLLTETYRPEERAKAQAINDFAVFTTVALASLSAGALQHNFGWRAVNLGIFPLLLLIISSILWLRMKMRLEKHGSKVTR